VHHKRTTSYQALAYARMFTKSTCKYMHIILTLCAHKVRFGLHAYLHAFNENEISIIQENLKLFLSSIYLKAHFRLQSYLQHFKNELQGKLIFHFH
jgi:hypothetical protein